jgi:hypothetical protein
MSFYGSSIELTVSCNAQYKGFQGIKTSVEGSNSQSAFIALFHPNGHPMENPRTFLVEEIQKASLFGGETASTLAASTPFRGATPVIEKYDSWLMLMLRSCFDPKTNLFVLFRHVT